MILDVAREWDAMGGRASRHEAEQAANRLIKAAHLNTDVELRVKALEARMKLLDKVRKDTP